MSLPSVYPASQNILDRSILRVSDADDGAPWALLADRGYRMLHARNAIEALEAFTRDPDIAVVIVDLDLTGGDGLDAIAALREAGLGRQEMEFLVIAGENALAAAVRAIKLQVQDFLVKPVSGEDLAAAVSDAYNLARVKRFQREEARSLEASLADFKTRTHAAVSQLIARAHGAYNIAPPAQVGSPSPEDQALQAFIAEECERARLREKIFGALAQNHAVWLLLLALWDSQLTGTELTIKSVAYSAGLPLSSALRRINEMCAAGLVRRRSDPDDARRSFVTLTPQGHAYFSRYFTEWRAGKQVRRLAAGQ